MSLIIRQFDLERIFFPPQNENGHSVQCFTWCLDEMQMPWQLENKYLKQFLARFLALDIYAVLAAWMAILKAEHIFYQKLFTEEEFKQHYQEPITLLTNKEIACLTNTDNSWFSLRSQSIDLSFLTIPLGADWLYEIAKRLSLIQNQIHNCTITQAPISMMILLKQLHPSHHARYQLGFEEVKTTEQLSWTGFPLAWTHLKNCALAVFNTEPHLIPRAALPWLRFHYLSRGSYHITAQGHSVSLQGNKAQMLSKSLKAPDNFSLEMALKIRAGTELSPNQADERLQKLERRSGLVIISTLLNPQNNIIPGQKTELLERFYRLPHRVRMELIKPILSNIEIEKAKGIEFIDRIIQLMKGIPFTELDLSSFADVLTDNLLLELVTSDYAGEYLSTLKLAKCKKLTNASILDLANHAPHLTCLDLSDTGITQIGGKEPVVLENLQYLNLSNDNFLTKIKLHAPQLEKLDAQGCVQLVELVVKAKSGATADLAGCERLEDKDVLYCLYFTNIGFRNLETNIQQAIRKLLLLPSTEKIVIDLTSKRIHDADVIHIAEAIKVSCSLASIYLGHNYIGDEGAQHLAEAIKVNCSLILFSLHHNPIGHVGGQHMAEALKKNYSLTTLELWDTQIDNGDWDKIRSFIIRNCKLAKQLITAVTSQKLDQVQTLIARGVHPLGDFVRNNSGNLGRYYVDGGFGIKLIHNSLFYDAVTLRNPKMLQALLQHSGVQMNRKHGLEIIVLYSSIYKEVTALKLAYLLGYSDCVAVLQGKSIPVLETQASSAMTTAPVTHLATSQMQTIKQENNITLPAGIFTDNNKLTVDLTLADFQHLPRIHELLDEQSSHAARYEGETSVTLSFDNDARMQTLIYALSAIKTSSANAMTVQ